MMLYRLPWITMLIAAVTMLNPLGQDILHAAFFSGEQLARGIWQPIVYSAGAILIALAVLEWWTRAYIRRRRNKGAARG